MITIISPATTMDFNKKIDLNKDSIPFFIKESNYLIDILKTLNLEEVKSLMNLSDDLANLNIDRYKNFGLENNPKSQSILAFDGEVFNCMNVNDFNKDDFEFVTYGENSHFIKPNLNYYKEILSRLNVKENEVLMVGNDVEEDMISGTLGFQTYLVMDHLLSRNNKENEIKNRGSSQNFYNYVRENL